MSALVVDPSPPYRSLFCLVSSNKKRPNNVVLGRLFDHQLLDMQEFGIVDYRPIADIAGPKIGIGSKHPMIFTGQAFEQRPEFQRVKSLVLGSRLSPRILTRRLTSLADFYQGQEVKLIDLAAMDHVMCWTADDDGQRLYLRVYRLVLKKSGSRLPRVELAEVGPAVDFELRRSLGASKETMHEALKVSRTIKPKKVKNVTQRTDGSYGRIHLGRQDLSQLHLRKIKGLKRRSGGEAEAQSNAPDAEAEEAVNDEPELTPRKRARRG